MIEGNAVRALAPLSGGTHAAAVAACEGTMRRLLFYTLEAAVAGQVAEADVADALTPDEAAGIHEEESEDALVAQVQISRPAVVITDVDLAQGSGPGACERIKRDPRTRATAVIIVSSRYERTDFDRALAAGADAFLRKPFSPLRLRVLAIQVGAEAAAVDAELAGRRVGRRGTGCAWGPGARRNAAYLLHPDRFDLPPAMAAEVREARQRTG